MLQPEKLTYTATNSTPFRILSLMNCDFFENFEYYFDNNMMFETDPVIDIYTDKDFRGNTLLNRLIKSEWPQL